MAGVLLFVGVAAGLTGCIYPENGASAKVMIRPTSAPGSLVSGDLTIDETVDGIVIRGTITGLTPGEHGLHIHKNYSCADADLPEDADTLPDPAGAAGPHWDPLMTMNHAGPDSAFATRHAGDLGNIMADAGGKAVVNKKLMHLEVEGMTHGVVGHAMIVHGGRDDLTSNPGGNSGVRMGCGLIMK